MPSSRATTGRSGSRIASSWESSGSSGSLMPPSSPRGTPGVDTRRHRVDPVVDPPDPRRAVAVLPGEVAGGDDDRGGAVGDRRAVALAERVDDRVLGEDVLDRPVPLELGVRVAEGVATAAAGHRRHGIGDGFQRRCRCDRQLVREPAPDQPEPRDGVVRPLDLVGVLLGDDNPEGEDVLCRLAQRRGVDPAHRDGAFLAEELARDRRALGGRHEALDRRVDRAHALVQRQGDQLIC